MTCSSSLGAGAALGRSACVASITGMGLGATAAAGGVAAGLVGAASFANRAHAAPTTSSAPTTQSAGIDLR